MKTEEIDSLVRLRTQLIERYNKLKDFRQNRNAIMRELDHAEVLHETIVSLDSVLREHVKFD